MKMHMSLKSGKVLAFKLLFVLPFLLYTCPASTQSPADFSGNWTLDQAKSDKSFKDYKVVCQIVQTTDSITVGETFFQKDGKKVTAPANTYSLDGKETSKEEFGGINKKSAKWSPDKKILIITITRTVDTNVYGNKITYKLSDAGRVLTVQTTDIDASSGMPAIIEVFNKD
jgi:hypothetical protein